MNINLNSKINIITGDNGSGKSTILSEIAIQEYKNGNNVICISNTPLHKFKRNTTSRYHVLKQTSRALDDSLKKIILDTHYSNKNNKRTNIFVNVLEYLNFDNIISFEVSIVPYESLFRKLESEVYKDETNESEIHEIIAYLKNRVKIEEDDTHVFSNFRDKSVKLELEYYFGSKWDTSILKAPIQLILKYEKILRKCKLVSSIKISLIRINDYIPTSQVSSGEASYLSTLAFILSNLDERDIIVVDEPENSLHPRWQKKYTSNIFDILEYLNAKLVLATHSPMIVIGAIEESNSLNLMKAKNNEITYVNSNETNIDEVMVDVFGVLTSRSRFFSYKINEILTNFNEKYLSFEDSRIELDRLVRLGPDTNQKNIILAASNILEEMNKDG